MGLQPNRPASSMASAVRHNELGLLLNFNCVTLRRFVL